MADKKIGKYTYSDSDELGRGAFARVYLAKKYGQSDGVAIKLFSRESRESFISESEVYKHIGNLNHHILRLEDTGEEDGQLYIVFQQAQEETLRDQIKQISGKPFGTERALAILRQIGSAIIAIHDENTNVIHGDIRPENILFDKNNQALLADFGMAVRLSSKDEKVFKPSPQGDPLYMAPERFGVDSLLTRESDQYSLGCIAYELFAGRHPLGLVTPQQADLIKRKINMTEYGNPCEYNKLLPDFIGKAILKALAKNAEGRYRSVEEFIDALIKIPTLIGYGQRYPAQQPLLKNLEMPKEGYFKHLTSFLADRGNEYKIASKTNRVGFHKFTYTHVTAESGEARNLVYVPVEFIVNLDLDHYNAVNSVIRLLLETEEPTLIFYDSFEAPDLKIIEICDHLDTLQAGIWFMPMKYMYDFEVAEGEQKEWIEEIWKMTSSYKKRK